MCEACAHDDDCGLVLLFVSSVPDFVTKRDCFVAAFLAMTGLSSVIASEAKQSAPINMRDLILENLYLA